MVEAIFLLCAISPGYMTSGLQEQYMKQLRRVAPFAYIKTLTRTAGGRPVVAIQLGCGCTKVLVTGTHHANESITGTLLWELLLTYCRAICNGGTFGGKSARALYRNSMLYCVPLVNPDGADLVAGAIPEASPEYVQAAAIADVFPQIPFPDGWKANLRGVDLNLNYPASWDLAKQRVLQRRIAAAHDSHIRAFIKRAVADCAIRYAAAGKRVLLRKTELPVRCAGCKDHSLCFQCVVCAGNKKAVLRLGKPGCLCKKKLCAERFCLLGHLLGKLCSGN